MDSNFRLSVWPQGVEEHVNNTHKLRCPQQSYSNQLESSLVVYQEVRHKTVRQNKLHIELMKHFLWRLAEETSPCQTIFWTHNARTWTRTKWITAISAIGRVAEDCFSSPGFIARER